MAALSTSRVVAPAMGVSNPSGCGAKWLRSGMLRLADRLFLQLAAAATVSAENFGERLAAAATFVRFGGAVLVVCVCVEEYARTYLF